MLHSTLPTLLGPPRTRITHSLLGDSKAITSRDRPTMIEWSSCIRLQTTANTQQLPTLLVQQCCTWLNAIAHALVGFLARSISRKVLSICCREPKGTVHTCANTPDLFLLAICYVKELECILFAVLFVSQWGKIEKST